MTGVLKNQSDINWLRSYWVGQTLSILSLYFLLAIGWSRWLIYTTPMFFVVLGVEPRTSCMLDKCSTAEL